MKIQNNPKNAERVKLIFNPGSGVNDQSPVQLMDVIKEMQDWKFVPEPYLIEPDCDLEAVVRDAMAQGIRLFAVCGGDGTIATVAKALIGTKAILGIIPTGTQNNIALSLGIPPEIPAAIAILRAGRRIKVDIGLAACGDISTPFIEVCTVGLLSTLFPAGDDIQHGNLARIGDFFASLTTSPPSEIRLLLDDKLEITEVGHVVMITNTPYVGRNYQVGSLDAFADGLLDVSFFADLSKLDLIGYILNEPGAGTPEDPRIQHFRVHSIVIETNPAMPVMTDGIPLGEGSVRVEVRRHALTVIAGSPVPKVLPDSGECNEK